MFWGIFSCPVHIVHDTFWNGVPEWNFNFDQLAVDANPFFKLSRACCEEYASMESSTEIVSQSMF